MPVILENVDPKRTAVIVVDMQNDFVAPGAPMETPMGTNFVPKLNNFLDECRELGMYIIYTAHVHREDGSDMGQFEAIWEPIRERKGLVDGTPGGDIYTEIKRQENEPVIKKHRYSAFFGTDVDMLLRGRDIENVIVTGVTTENCCHATARDAMFLGYNVGILSDLTGTFDYPDTGHGAVPAEEVHRVSLAILGVSTGHVLTSEEFLSVVNKEILA